MDAFILQSSETSYTNIVLFRMRITNPCKRAHEGEICHDIYDLKHSNSSCGEGMESFAKRLGPAHIDPRVWPRPQHSAAKWHPSCAVVDSPTVGRHVVAQHSINPGTVLVSEYPYLQYLYPPHRPTHCANCFRQNTSWKCRNQSCKWRVSYCSSQCERRYWQIIHQWFCSLPELQDLFDADALLAWQAYWLNQVCCPFFSTGGDKQKPHVALQTSPQYLAWYPISIASHPRIDHSTPPRHPHSSRSSTPLPR